MCHSLGHSTDCSKQCVKIVSINFGNAGTTRCYNSCHYCDLSQTFCGKLSYIYRETERKGFVGTTVVTEKLQPRYVYFWEYTHGQTGYYSLTMDINQATCIVDVNGKQCLSCKPRVCTNGKYEPLIDCKNLELGAVASTCTNPKALGPTSLDETSFNSVRGPFVFPFYGCEAGLMTLLSSKNPGTVLVVAPTSPPVANISDGAPSQANTMPVVSAPTIVPLMIVPASGDSTTSVGGIAVMALFSQATVTGILWVILATKAF
jgi:hypothetical protein